MTSEEPLGALIYGYDEEDAAAIGEILTTATGTDVMVLSASGREDEKVALILSQPSKKFEAGSRRILMFLGFDDAQVQSVLAAFPRDAMPTRPIFCGLTSQNMGWEFQQLLEHLLEEEAYWKQRDALLEQAKEDDE